MEYYINEFQNYIKQLCSDNVDILHNDNTNVAFVRFQSHDDLNQVSNQGAKVIVIIARYYGRAIGETADDMDMKQFVQIRFAVAAIPDPLINYSDVITAAEDKAFTIMMDFIAKFKQDQFDNDCGPLRGLDLPNCSWSEIPEQPYLLQHYGWDLTLPFKSAFPGYNADKWVGKVDNWTGFEYNQETGEFTFQGDDGGHITQIRFLDPDDPQFGYTNAEGTGVTGQAFQGNKTTNQFLSPGPVVISYRKVGPAPGFAALTDWENETLNVTRRSQRTFRVWLIEANRELSAGDFPVSPVNIVGDNHYFMCNSIDFFLSDWFDDAANNQKAQFISVTPFPASGPVVYYNVLVAPADPENPVWGFSKILASTQLFVPPPPPGGGGDEGGGPIGDGGGPLSEG